MNALRYAPKYSEYAALVMLDNISHLYKSLDGETTFIALRNGEILQSEESLNTLEARINSLRPTSHEPQNT